VNGKCWIRRGVPLEPSTRAGQADKELFDALLTIIAEVEAEQRDERLNAILTHHPATQFRER
jgi:hypothetical protein